LKGRDIMSTDRRTRGFKAPELPVKKPAPPWRPGDEIGQGEKAKRAPARAKKKAAAPKIRRRPPTAAPRPSSPPASKPRPTGPVAAEAPEGPSCPPRSTSSPTESVANEAPAVIGAGEAPQPKPDTAQPT
jgi:hypothetical protein